ncbi:hypothetical protein [Chromobacterium sphagni]|uniref:Uncharacterized protein n=1 Tax=Chromobacterium sphagni TaxID=1903179 RepID=A0ABX3C8U5_9NEIS|nr:hypothetical protein [Chromobacterium sphagni]OHX18117.1 hypothetical protein BI344_11330 [Chromobacterium sphagni]
MSILPAPRHLRLPRRPLAIAASLLLHALAFFALKAVQQQPAAAPQALRVQILPISLPAPASPSPAASPAPRRASVAARAAPPAAITARPGKAARQGKTAASAASAETRVTIEGLRQQMRHLEPEKPNAKPLQAEPEKARLARNIDQAQRKDCKTAYSGLGLLAAPFLLKDALDKDNGCKW